MNYMELVWYQLTVVIIIHMDNTPRKPISEGFFLQHYHIPRWIRRKYERLQRKQYFEVPVSRGPVRMHAAGCAEETGRR